MRMSPSLGHDLSTWGDGTIISATAAQFLEGFDELSVVLVCYLGLALRGKIWGFISLRMIMATEDVQRVFYLFFSFKECLRGLDLESTSIEAEM